MIIRALKIFGAIYISMVALYMQCISSLTFLAQNGLLQPSWTNSYFVKNIIHQFTKFDSQTRFFLNSFCLLAFVSEFLLVLLLFLDIFAFITKRVFKFGFYVLILAGVYFGVRYRDLLYYLVYLPLKGLLWPKLMIADGETGTGKV